MNTCFHQSIKAGSFKKQLVNIERFNYDIVKTLKKSSHKNFPGSTTQLLKNLFELKNSLWIEKGKTYFLKSKQVAFKSFNKKPVNIKRFNCSFQFA